VGLGPILEVEFLDSCSLEGWNSRDQLAPVTADTLSCHAVGYLVHEDDSRLVLALAYTESEVMSPLAIPQAVIVGRKVLKK
jgi:hypothetical protein